MSKNINLAYEEAIRFTKMHYENFPVISFFLQKRFKKHIAVIYKFARLADDIADEGGMTKEERINLLDSFEEKFKNALQGQPGDSFWSALKNTIDLNELKSENFFRLLSAFRQDVLKNRYSDREELLNYCKNSADPVGRLILELFNIRGDDKITYSDSVCTGLQLTNFWQDVSLDLEKNRVYLPQSSMNEFGVTENDLYMKTDQSNFKKLLKSEVDFAEELLSRGEGLLPSLPISLKYQIKLTILGGKLIIKKIRNLEYDVLNVRPVLTKMDFLKLFIKSLRQF